MYCYNCGKEIDDGSAFCSHCGSKQRALSVDSDAELSLKNKLSEMKSTGSESILTAEPDEVSSEHNTITVENETEIKVQSKDKKHKGLIIAITVIILGLVLAAIVVLGGLCFNNFSSKKHISPEAVCEYFENQGTKVITVESLKNEYDSDVHFNQLFGPSLGIWYLANDYSDGLCIYIDDTEEYEQAKYLRGKSVTDSEAIFYYTNSLDDEKLSTWLRVESYEFDSVENAMTYFDKAFGSDVFRYALEQGNTSNGDDYIVWVHETHYECIYLDGKYIIYICGEDNADSSIVIVRVLLAI